MKHLRIFEDFENEMPEGEISTDENKLKDYQIDELNQYFEEFVESMERDRKGKVDNSELVDIFSVDDKGEISDDFVRFLDYLAENATWFNYDMMDEIKNEIAIIVGKMDIDYEDEDDFEFAQDDINWPYEKEESNLAHAEEEESESDDIEQLRQKSYQRYSNEDDVEKRKEEIFNKLADGEPLTDEDKEFLSKHESKKIFGFKKFNS